MCVLDMFPMGNIFANEALGSRVGSGKSAKEPQYLSGGDELANTRAALDDTPELVLWAQEQEREQIAVELHDSTSQHLVAITLGLAKLRRTLGVNSLTKDILDDMSASVGEAAKEIRVFSYLMKPSGLERDGLGTSAMSLVSGFGLRTGLNAHCRLQGALDAVDFEVGHAAFRVLQEALSNVYRHAGAKGVEVELVNRTGVLTLRIADDGRGIEDPLLNAGGAHRLGVGIVGMRARVQQLGGTLKITSTAAGTSVLARMRAALATVPTRLPARPRSLPRSRDRLEISGE